MKKRESKKGGSRNRVKIEVPVPLMKSLIAYLFSDHRSRHFIKKLYALLNIVDPASFTEDSDLDVLYAIVMTYVKTAIDDNVDSLPLLMNKVQAIQRFEDQVEEVLMDINDIAIDEDTAVFIENEFIDRLNFIEASPIIANLKRTISRFEKNDYDSFKEIIEEIRHDALVYTKTLQTRSSVALSIPSVSFHDPNLLDTITHVHRSLTDEKRNIQTGVKLS